MKEGKKISNYTTQVRFIVENYSTEGKPIRERIDEALPHIFDFDYPIWAESYRKTLERKIIKHFFNKEIGLETVELWKLYLDERLNLIMPLYNEMYLTVSDKYNWLEDVYTTERYEGNKNSTSNTNSDERKNSTAKTDSNGTNKTIDEGQDTSTSKNKGTAKGLVSDTPQANYSGGDYATMLKDDVTTNDDTVIVDRANTNTSTGTSTATSTDNLTGESSSTSTNTDNDVYTRTMRGLNGSRSKTQLNVEYRNSLINIDKQIIEELYDLFMLIYGGVY